MGSLWQHGGPFSFESLRGEVDGIRPFVRISAQHAGQLLSRFPIHPVKEAHLPLAKMSVLLDKDEEARFSAYCREKGFKKSTLVARLIREHLDREGYADQKMLPFSNDTEAVRRFERPSHKRQRKN
jgi:hypothetical protein